LSNNLGLILAIVGLAIAIINIFGRRKVHGSAPEIQLTKPGCRLARQSGTSLGLLSG